MDANKMQREKARWELNKNGMCYVEQIQVAILHKTALTNLSSYRPSKSDVQDMERTAGKTRTKSLAIVFL